MTKGTALNRSFSNQFSELTDSCLFVCDKNNCYMKIGVLQRYIPQFLSRLRRLFALSQSSHLPLNLASSITQCRVGDMNALLSG